MTYLRALLHDIGTSIRVGWCEFRFIRRHLRRGGCPDNRPEF
jgi:hypothetical protein